MKFLSNRFSDVANSECYQMQREDKVTGKLVARLIIGGALWDVADYSIDVLKFDIACPNGVPGKRSMCTACCGIICYIFKCLFIRVTSRLTIHSNEATVKIL